GSVRQLFRRRGAGRRLAGCDARGRLFSSRLAGEQYLDRSKPPTLPDRHGGGPTPWLGTRSARDRRSPAVGARRSHVARVVGNVAGVPGFVLQATRAGECRLVG